MAKKKNSMRKEVSSGNRRSPATSAKRDTRQVFQEDRNIPTFDVGLPMPQAAKPPKENDGADLSPSQREKSSLEKPS